MREIKFRAWLKNENKMAKVHSIHLNKKKVMVTYRTSYGASGNCSIDDGDFILQQYIGLKDKNGKEIYEGDIVRSGSSTAIVEWDDYIDQDFYWGNACGFVFNFDPETMSNQASNSGVDYEVIGNIFEGVDK